MAAQATFFEHIQGPHAVLLGSQAIHVEALPTFKGPVQMYTFHFFCISKQKKENVPEIESYCISKAV